MGFLAEFAVTRNVRKLHIAKNLVYGQVCQQHLSTDFCTSCCLFVDVLSAHQLADALKVAIMFSSCCLSFTAKIRKNLDEQKKVGKKFGGNEVFIYICRR